MAYYLTVDNKTEKYDNEMAYYLEIIKLRDQGYIISYDETDNTICKATI